MRRQLEKRRRERDNIDATLSTLISKIRGDTTSSENLSVDPTLAVKEFFALLRGDDVSGNIAGDRLTKLCESLQCDAGDLLRIAKTVPRSQSTRTEIKESELSFAVMKAMAPVDVRQRRMQSSNGGAITEDASSLVRYYKAAFAWEEADWQDFLRSASTALPMTFRVHRSEPALSAMIEHHLRTPNALSDMVKPVEAVGCTQNSTTDSPCAMYGCSHEVYHSQAAGELWARTLHASSCVSFQEVVSAIPVAVLDPKPGMRVLDMCAAPGSKSLQALDSISRNIFSNSSNGVVWLNEKDRTKATQTLPARLKRYHAPNVMITRCDGTQLPRLFRSDSSQVDEVQFDRIICDVPCSGDGTVRKERSVLASWSEEYVASLVVTQRALLRRAIDLLAVGGIVVFSTCSMNPAEDEEVVLDALQTYGSCCELVDVSETLAQRGFTIRRKGPIPVRFQEPTVTIETNDRRNLSVDLTKMLRVMPHHHYTGGFFVAALRKVTVPNMSQPTVSVAKLNQWMNHKRWLQVPTTSDPEWRSIMSFFGINAERESAFLEHFRPVFNVNPNGGPQRRIVATSPALESMIFKTKPFKGPGLELVSIGVRAFEAYDGKFLAGAKCRWRAVTEFASRLSHYATKRKLTLNLNSQRDLLLELFQNGHIEVSDDVVSSLLRDEEWWTPNEDNSEQEASPRALCLGSVLLAVEGGPMNLSDALGTAWWLSCTLSYRKLELAVDESMRTFALLTLFGIEKTSATLEASNE